MYRFISENQLVKLLLVGLPFLAAWLFDNSGSGNSDVQPT